MECRKFHSFHWFELFVSISQWVKMILDKTMAEIDAVIIPFNPDISIKEELEIRPITSNVIKDVTISKSSVKINSDTIIPLKNNIDKDSQ